MESTNLQSLNRYSYAGNNPATLNDLLGLGTGPYNPNEGVYQDCAGFSSVTDPGACAQSSSWTTLMPHDTCKLGNIPMPCFAGLEEAAAPCPNNDCSWQARQGPNGSTVWAKWVPDTWTRLGPASFYYVPGHWENVGTVQDNGTYPCFGGDVTCDSAGNVVRINGNIESDNVTNMAIAGAFYAPLDISMQESGNLFGTGRFGNSPLFNYNDYLRVGWSYLRNEERYSFRIAGKALDWLTGVPKTHWWIWGGPPE